MLLLAPARGEAQTSPDLSPVNIELIRPHVVDGRWLWLGDSFAVPARARVSLSTLITWPLPRVGGLFVGPASQFGRHLGSGVPPQEVADAQGFLLAAGTPTEERMGLPVYRMLEWNLPAGESDLGEISLGFSKMLDGYAALDGSPFDGETTVRPLVYSRPGAASKSLIRYAESGGPVSLPEGFSLGEGRSVVLSSDRRVPVRATLEAPEIVHLAGTLITGDPGHYAQFLADGSWSYAGFGSDADPAPEPTSLDSLKRFRTDDLANFLSATTLDPAQTSVVALYLAAERRSPELLQLTLERVVAQVRDAFGRAGLDEPLMLFIHPHAIETPVVGTPEENERVGVVMREMALADDRIAFVSLYDATDGIVFDGRPEARAWLEASPYAQLCFGTRCTGGEPPIDLLAEYGANLLDDFRLHPIEPGALFFSALLGEILTGQPVRSCDPDEPPTPLGVLSPNPVGQGRPVFGALADRPVYDALGRLVGRTGTDGEFTAPSVAGVYFIDGKRLVVQ